MNEVRFTELLEDIVDNRGKSVPTSETGTALIATNCIKEDSLYPTFENVRFVDDERMETWFRGHPIPGDILFVCKGSPGRVVMVPEEVNFCIAQDMVSLRPDATLVYPKYLFAALRSNLVRKRIESMHVGSLIPHFKKGDFDQLMIPLPEMKVQVSIGDQYFAISERIQSGISSINLLERLGAALLEQSMANDELTTDITVGDVLGIMETGSRPKGGATSKGVVSLGAESVKSAGITGNRETKFVPVEFASQMKRGHLADGDILVYKDGAALSTSNSIVSAFGFGFPTNEAVVNEHVFRLQGNEFVSQGLLYWLLRSPRIDAEIRMRVTGAAQPGLNSENLRSVPLPSKLHELKRVLGSQLDQMLELMLKLGSQNNKLILLRDSLLNLQIAARISNRGASI
ncbi:type I restriction enzyme S subunit [Aurantimicrobium minutum]|uniref:restriction endonuclease subunit S n=1 Tax=Aurantimicrobium minutum TaxID=708131 RepID=UPI002476F625|nr:restriction endonuclease subunit S [Aurantimicrobium minutum]MDH6532452.1 type I restriction enzyme S subunit [Aurantimicrobium minutum]